MVALLLSQLEEKRERPLRGDARSKWEHFSHFRLQENLLLLSSSLERQEMDVAAAGTRKDGKGRLCFH